MAKKVNREEARYKIRLEQQLFIDNNRKYLPVSSLVKIVGISRSSYYKYKYKKINKNYNFNEMIKEYILECYQIHKGIYGKLRITLWINSTYKLNINHKRVYRLMKILGLKSVIRKKRQTRKYKSPEIVRENLLKRNFKSNKPNEKWSIDISYIPLKKSRFNYLCAIKDLYNNEIIEYKIGKYQTLELVESTIKSAIKKKKINKKNNLIIHSDQGFQFTHKGYVNLLERNKIKVSHSRRGNCLDNSPIENFFSHLKTEFKHLYNPKTDEETLEAIRKYIEFYNSKRIQIKLNGYSPKEYRTIA